MKSVNSVYVVACPLKDEKALAGELEHRFERKVRLSKDAGFLKAREPNVLSHIWWGSKREDGLWVELRRNEGLNGQFEVETHKDYEFVLFLRVNADYALGNGNDPEKIQGWSSEVVSLLPYKTAFIRHPE